jgi:hypothetical protein
MRWLKVDCEKNPAGDLWSVAHSLQLPTGGTLECYARLSKLANELCRIFLSSCICVVRKTDTSEQGNGVNCFERRLFGKKQETIWTIIDLK